MDARDQNGRLATEMLRYLHELGKIGSYRLDAQDRALVALQADVGKLKEELQLATSILERIERVCLATDKRDRACRKALMGLEEGEAGAPPPQPQPSLTSVRRKGWRPDADELGDQHVVSSTEAGGPT